MNHIPNIVLCIIASLILFFVSSCTEIIEIETGSADTRLVVYGEITNYTGVHRVRLSKTTDYFHNNPAPPVSGAKVTITDGVSVYTLNESNTFPGLYETPRFFHGIRGVTYFLKVENLDINGDGENEIYEATTYLPYLNPMDSIRLKYSSYPFFSGWELQLYTWDPAETRDYYSFKVYKNGKLLTNSINEYIVRSDEFFNGKYTNGITAQFLSDAVPKEKALPGDTIVFEINAITKDFFNFVQQVQSEIFTSTPLYSGPPANIVSNISNGALGFFHAYAIDRKHAFVPDYP